MQNVTQNQFPPIDEYGGILNLIPTDGKIELFGRLWPVRQIRPNYQVFIKESFQPVDKCLEVLLGMRLFITGALQFPVEALSGDEFSWWWNNIRESEQDCDVSKLWDDIFVVQDKISEIYRVLILASKAGQIDSAMHKSTLKIGPPREECYLSTKSFLLWGIENGYSLPGILGVELGQNKPVDQKVKHADAWESATVLDSYPDRDISNEQALNDAVSIVSEDVSRLYKGMKEILKAKGLTLSNADESQQKQACKKFYDKNSDNFTSLKLDHVEGAINNSTYWGTNNSARDIKGGLFQQFIIHEGGEYSYLAADKNLKLNFQDLYSLFTKLQKNVLKQS